MTKRPTRVVAALAAVLLCSAAAQAQSPTGLDHGQARVVKSQAGRTLTGPSTAAAASVVAGYLARQRAAADVAALRTLSSRPSRSGLTHVRLQQEVQGLEVHGAYAKAAVDSQGRLVHLIDNLARVSTVQAARIDAADALRAAMQQVHPRTSIAFGAATVEGNTTRFGGGGWFFHRDPQATAVAIPMSNGTLQRGYLVETWTRIGNQLHHTLVGGDGRVLDIELRTASDSYNVFAISPLASSQAPLSGAGSGNDQSPIGWLAGPQTTLGISGNNVFAYLDRDADNAPDGGGSAAVASFLAAANLALEPTQMTNQEVAVQNLFYLSNRIHDILYRHGFDEAAGNFQRDNFGKGGRGNDPVQAEAQDGEGTDNANFATPNDGRAPRMQMFLWTGRPAYLVTAGSASYEAAASAFGPEVTIAGFAGTLRLASPADGCTALGTLPAGTVAIVDRGSCEFATKVLNAQNAGAIGVVIANNNTANPTEVFSPAAGADAPSVTIPSVLVGYASGIALKGLGQVIATAFKVDPPPLQIDASLDSDIVYHEYCHGLTWRMIGRMSGPLAGAVGEGMSDGCALLINDNNDVVAEYSASDPRGIRSAPYTNHPRTYGSIGVASGSPQVHFDGEIYGAIVWQMIQDFGTAERDKLFGYIVEGMNYTPAKPAYEDMRDGILAAIAAGGDPADCAKVWNAFARYGVGVGAKGTVRGQRIVITESKVASTSCN